MRAGECATRDPFWYWQVYLQNDSKRIRDYRNGRKFNEEILLTSTDRDLATCPKPGFGKFDEIVGRIFAVLRSAGYGEIA